MKLLDRIGCLAGSHHRDGRAVKFDRGEYRSTCTGCGKPMIRTLDGWQLRVDGEQPSNGQQPG